MDPLVHVFLAGLATFSLDTSNADHREFGTEPGYGVEAGVGAVLAHQAPFSLRGEMSVEWLPKDRHGNNSHGLRLSADGATYEVKTVNMSVWPTVSLGGGLSAYVGGGGGLATGDYSGPVVQTGAGFLYQFEGTPVGLDLGVRYIDASGYDLVCGRVAVSYAF